MTVPRVTRRQLPVRAADVTDGALGPYFAALQRTPLLTAHDELALAREIDRLVVEHWRVLLSYGNAWPHLASAVEQDLSASPRVLEALRARSPRVVGPAAARLARRLRRLDSSGAVLRKARTAVQAALASDRKATGYLRRVARTYSAEQAAKQRFVTANLRLVIAMARRHSASTLPLADLIQEGNFGLLRAVEGFDHRRGYRFSTYATWWIRQAIRRAIADRGRLVRVPVHALEDISRMTRVSGSIAALTGAAPDLAQLAAVTALPESKLAVLSTPGLLKTAVSLDRTFQDDDNRTLHETLPAESARSAEEVADLESWHFKLERLLVQLSPIEVATVRLRYGLDGQELTLKEIGDRYGLSRERIRQIQGEALEKLREALALDRSDDDGKGVLAA